MRTVFCVVLIANVLLWLVSLVVLPDQVAVHFGRGGVPDSWASKEWNALVFVLLEAPLFLVYTAVWSIGLIRSFRVPDDGGVHG